MRTVVTCSRVAAPVRAQRTPRTRAQPRMATALAGQARLRAMQLSSKHKNSDDLSLLMRSRVESESMARKLLKVSAVDDPDNPNIENMREEATGRPNAIWRVLACLPYLVPLMGSLAFGNEVYTKYPLTSILIILFQPLLQVYYSNNFTPFIVFFALFLIVVRSQKLPHFLRFNALQSMLVDISVMLGGLIIQYLPFEIQHSWLGKMGSMLTFVSGTGAVAYAVFYTLQGKYCDIPVISEAVYIQLQR